MVENSPQKCWPCDSDGDFSRAKIVDEGAYAIAAPIRQAGGEVHAVLGVAGLAARVPSGDLTASREAVLSAVSALSAALGYEPPYDQAKFVTDGPVASGVGREGVGA